MTKCLFGFLADYQGICAVCSGSLLTDGLDLVVVHLVGSTRAVNQLKLGGCTQKLVAAGLAGCYIDFVFLCTVDLFPLDDVFASGGTVGQPDQRTGAVADDLNGRTLLAVRSFLNTGDRLNLVVVGLADLSSLIGVGSLAGGSQILILTGLGGGTVHSVLRSIGYDGYYSLEWESPWRPEIRDLYPDPLVLLKKYKLLLENLQ